MEKADLNGVKTSKPPAKHYWYLLHDDYLYKSTTKLSSGQ